MDASELHQMFDAQLAVKSLRQTMRNIPLRRQFAIFLLILVLSYASFTLFPSLFPHPEDFSPYAYVVAFVACLEIWLLTRDKQRKWLLLPVLLICLLALLDETGYGSEVTDIPPIYSQSLHAEIRDLHNLIGILSQLGGQALEEARWNGSLFAAFLTLDAILIAAGTLFARLFRLRSATGEENSKRWILWLTAGFWLACGVSATVYLLSLPQDPRNAVFLGYSTVRLASILAIFLLSTLPLLLMVFTKSNKPLKAISTWLTRNSRIVSITSLLLLLAGVVYQFYAQFVFLPDEATRLQRFTPIVLWLMAAAWFALLSAHAWRGGLRQPVVHRVAEFLRREPAYFYMGCAVVLIFIAQLIDQEVIPLNSMIQTPDFHVRLWGLWTEETFEMTGAFLFIAAAFHFPKTK